MMKARMSAVAVSLALVLGACGQGGSPAKSAAPAAPVSDTLSAAQLAAAYKVIKLTPASGGKVMNDCSEAVTPQVNHADLGGAVGRAWLVQVGGGPTTAGCYGNSGRAFWLLQTEGDTFRVILEGSASIAVLTTQHNGVKDVAIAGPGLQHPVFAWNGSTYAHQGSINDSDMPPAVD